MSREGKRIFVQDFFPCYTDWQLYCHMSAKSHTGETSRDGSYLGNGTVNISVVKLWINGRHVTMTTLACNSRGTAWIDVFYVVRPKDRRTKKAFHTTWQSTLLHKLPALEFSRSRVKLIASILTDNFKVLLEGEFSTPKI